MGIKSKLVLISVMMGTLSGCVSSIGQEDFTCPIIKKGGVCAGPRDIYELTNNRVSLENLTAEELHNQVHKDQHGVSTSELSRGQDSYEEDNYVYEPRTNEQHTSIRKIKAIYYTLQQLN